MKTIIATLFLLASTQQVIAQGIFNKIKNIGSKDSSKNILNSIKGSNSKGLSSDDIVSGLKDALRVATDSTSKNLGATGGFFKNQAIKILMPAEALKAEKTLRTMGAGQLVDKAILSMNSAAENAAGQVGDIFLTAIKQMTVTDGLNILRGGDFAATDYLKKTTTAILIQKMKPVIDNSLKSVGADKYWAAVFNKYNMFSQQKVEADLSTYATTKALDGMFYNIAQQEQKIRKDPAAQVTDILKKVFAK